VRRFGRPGVRWIAVVACTAMLAVAVPSAREFRSIEVDSLKVTIDSDWAPRAAPGYWPVRFDITNLGEARVIEIVGSGSRSFRAATSGVAIASSSIRQQVSLGRGDHVHLTMALPIFGDSESASFEIREDTHVIQRFNYLGFLGHVPWRAASVLVIADPSAGLSTVAARIMRKLTGPARAGTAGAVFVTPSGRGSGSGAPVQDFVLEPDRVPTNWLGFTSLRAVVIGGSEWGQINESQRGALLAWTAAGGTLILADADVATILPSVHGERATNPDRVVASYLFGHVQAMTSAALTALPLDDLLSAADTSTDLRWALPVNRVPDFGAIEARGFRLRIPGIDGVPARAFLGILLLFTLLIGPANYWWLWRKRQLSLLVFTVPLISAVFIVFLAGYAIAGEGFRVQGRAVTFTMLDQRSKLAATRATVSMYAAGMTPSAGLRFDRDAAVFPLGQDGAGPRASLAVDLSDDQRFTAGMIQARSPVNFEEVTVRAARQRLEFTRDGAGVTVTNGLDATVESLTYRDGDLVYRLAGPLVPGARQMLSLANGGTPDAAIPARFLDLAQHLASGAYLAVLDRSPFWDPGVAALTERGSAHVVLGWPEGQP